MFSSDPARSRAAGVALGFDAERSYGDVRRDARRGEAAADGIDAVAIMTPNDTHYPFAAAALDAGLDVVCDKPVTHDFAQACDLVARTRGNGRLFAIAHGYTAYPMTRYARQLVRDGALGALRLVQVEYIQSGHGDARRGRPAEQPPPLDPRSAAQRARAGDERDRLPRAASRVASSPGATSRACSPTSARWCPAARSSTTCRRCSSSTAARAARSP